MPIYAKWHSNAETWGEHEHAPIDLEQKEQNKIKFTNGYVQGDKMLEEL